MAKIKKAAPKKAVAKKAPVAAAKTVPAKSPASGPAPVFNIAEINELIHAVNQSNVSELKLKRGDFKITIRQGTSAPVMVSAPVHVAPVAAPAPVATPAATPAAAPSASPAPAPEAASDNVITIKSPMIGTFYRSSGPGKPVFVNVGDEIKVGQVLCIVEAMKLFNEIESEMNGRIVKVLVDDSSPVEYDQPLFLVQPA